MDYFLTLSNIRHEIIRKREYYRKIEEIETELERCTQMLKSTPHSTALNDTKEILLDRKNKYINLIKSVEEKTTYAEIIISECEDSLVRVRMERRFLDGRSWGQCAMKEGGYNSADAVRKSVVRYLRRLDEPQRLV